VGKYTSVVSLNDRQKVIEHFGFPCAVNFSVDSPGKKLVQSNLSLIEGFAKWPFKGSVRTISKFLYTVPMKDLWKSKEDLTGSVEDEMEPEMLVVSRETEDPALFYMESQLEDFLIENWDRTELGKKYELIEEDGEIVSQQYSTGIGKIDILAQDRKTKQLVVIELKKNQTSDDTVGQLTRYMGFLEEHKTKGNPTKGIIIASKYDERLYYALKKVRDVEVYLYRVDFHLKEFEKPS
jgi:hypothetical protein